MEANGISKHRTFGEIVIAFDIGQADTAVYSHGTCYHGAPFVAI
jgi:hypothetical protein